MLRSFFLVFTVFFVISSNLFAAEPIVKRLELVGLKRIDEFAVRNKISQKPGTPLSSNRVSDDIKRIFAMGYFEDVKVEMEFFEGGIKLIYILKEKPTISQISFYGNEEFDDEKLKEQITLSRGAIADSALIQDNALKLKAFYESEGYWLAEVVPVVGKITDTAATVTYLINEQNKVKIESITIDGNEGISDDDIMDVMETSEWWFFSFLTSGGNYSNYVMKQDIENIKDLYFDNGYINVGVSEPRIRVDEDREKMSITISISEGRQYSVSSLKVSGNANVSYDELSEIIKLKEGDIFSRKTLTEDIRALTDFYSERGYAMVSIDPEVGPVRDTNTVRIVYRIIEGDTYHIGRIEITGNTKTRDKVIRREVLLDEGDLFKSTFIKGSYRRLNNLNFFDAVQIQPKPRPKEKLLDIDINVKERPTGSLSIGGGYSTTDKFVGMVDFTQGNLFGKGQNLKLKGQFGSTSTFYELSFIDPWFLDKPLSMSVSLYRTTREYFDYDRKATGFSIGFGKRLDEYWRANASYNFEEVTILDVQDTASDIIKNQEGASTTSSVSPSLIRDSRDYFLDPHEGSKNGLYLKYAGLGGDNNYFKVRLDSGWFFPVGPTTLSFRGRFGYATGLFDKELPLYERYYVGGINTVRGLRFGEAGPKDETGNRIGGTKELIFNAEYIVPLIPEARIKGLLFFDAGKAYDQDENIDALRRTAGIGIRWISPIGPMRFEWGYNLDRKTGEDQSKFEFTFGTFF